jgi:hypothetical protein
MRFCCDLDGGQTSARSSHRMPAHSKKFRKWLEQIRVVVGDEDSNGFAHGIYLRRGFSALLATRETRKPQSDHIYLISSGNLRSERRPMRVRSIGKLATASEPNGKGGDRLI